jgi:hypothetical protein
VAPPIAPTEKPKAPTIEDLLALIKAQGDQIAALTAKTDQVAAASRDERPKQVFDLPVGPPWSIRVRAVRQGFYPNPERNAEGKIVRGTRHIRRFGRSDEHGGDEFVIEKPEDFAGGPLGWMELATAPATTTVPVPPTPASRPVQDPLMQGILPTPGNPQHVIES